LAFGLFHLHLFTVLNVDIDFLIFSAITHDDDDDDDDDDDG